jgi:hypothetical protein
MGPCTRSRVRGLVELRQEGEALDVVPVVVRHEEVRVERAALVLQLPAERADAGARVEDQAAPVGVRTSTQLVLPPKRTVSGPGAGMEPRVPQQVTRSAGGNAAGSFIRAGAAGARWKQWSGTES